MEQIDFLKNDAQKKYAPLALKMAPNTLESFMGQEGIIGKGKLLRRLIESDSLRSVIFFGPSGTGKSALSRIIASKTKAYFQEASAVTVGISDIRKVISAAKARLETLGKKTILMLDEIHHFNRSQQDALLPDVERGVITLMGITTENPFFYINAAIISRSTVFEFFALSNDVLLKILESALADIENGLGAYNVEILDDAKKHLILNSDGDARKLLNALEIGTLSTQTNSRGVRVFDISVAQESLQKRAVVYDKASDAHYNHISAFIKSMRGSDPDASIYWLAKMLLAGEDPRFIARRIIICASEDVGMADPRALMIAVSALEAVKFIGMPEARIILSQATIYVATSPKSNSAYVAIGKALNEVESGKVRQVPDYLKDSTLDGKELGHGKGYKYPHDFQGHYVEQDYFPNPVELYSPSKEGYEGKLRERLFRIKKKTDKN